MEFRWNNWNTAHIAEHGVTVEEAEYIVRNAQLPYPRVAANDKRQVVGQTDSGEFLQVFFIYSPPGVILCDSRPPAE